MDKAQRLKKNSFSLDAKVEFLKRAGTYPEASRVEVKETHMSWIFLTDRYVYKLKKPVRHDFLDFRTPEARGRYCGEEVRINKALAGDTYIGVVALKIHHGSLQLDGEGVCIDWLVKMKRLPEAEMLDAAVKKGTADKKKVQQAAQKLADFYLAAAPVRMAPRQYRKKFLDLIESTQKRLLKMEPALPQGMIIHISEHLLRFVKQRADLFEERIAAGRVADCHGDLRPEHICLAPEPVIIDRIEFDRNLRIMDVAEELSFLLMECEVLDSAATGEIFLNTYKTKNQDNPAPVLISFYKAEKAFLRAWLSIHHLLENRYRAEAQKWRRRCGIYLEMAEKYAKKANI